MTQAPPLLRDQRKGRCGSFETTEPVSFRWGGISCSRDSVYFRTLRDVSGLFCQSRHVAESKAEPTTGRVFGHIQVVLRRVCDLVCCLGDIKCDVRIFHPLEETPNLLFNCFGYQLLAHAAWNGAGRIHDHSARSRFRSGTI